MCAMQRQIIAAANVRLWMCSHRLAMQLCKGGCAVTENEAASCVCADVSVGRLLCNECLPS